MKSKLQDGPINGSEKSLQRTKEIPSLTGLANDVADDVVLISKYRKDVDDPLFIDRLVEIVKTSSPTLQRKAVSVLEFVTVIDPTNHSILSSDIESGLEAVFKQKVITEAEETIEAEQPERYAVEIEEML